MTLDFQTVSLRYSLADVRGAINNLFVISNTYKIITAKLFSIFIVRAITCIGYSKWRALSLSVVGHYKRRSSKWAGTFLIYCTAVPYASYSLGLIDVSTVFQY